MSVLAIEDCFLKKISTLFRSSLVEMNDEDISRLAGETEECSRERSRLEEKRVILEASLRRLKRALEQNNVMDAFEHDQPGIADSHQAPAVEDLSSSMDNLAISESHNDVQSVGGDANNTPNSD